MEENFNVMLNMYYKLSPYEKKERLISELKEMIMVYTYYAQVNCIDINAIKINEILNVNENLYNDDNFIDIIYTYLNVLKNVVSNIIEIENEY